LNILKKSDWISFNAKGRIELLENFTRRQFSYIISKLEKKAKGTFK
jgi:hypothetical protein